MTELQKESQLAQKALQRAVEEALDKKQRLGQYAVIYKDGKPVRIEGNKASPSSDLRPPSPSRVKGSSTSN